MVKVTIEELEEIKNELVGQLAFTKSVEGNTKDLEKKLAIVELAKIGLNKIKEND